MADPSPAEILARQRAAFLMDGPPDLARRLARLKALREAVLAGREALEQAVATDFGHRSRHETAILELLVTIRGIDYLRANLRRFLRPSRRGVPLALQLSAARVDYPPLGVIGIIAPWNYPVSLSLMPLATALAAGNRAMLKPSELTPATAAALKALLAERFPPEEVAVLTDGPDLAGADLGAAFAALPFDHLFFTGSTAVGRKVMQAAAANLVPVTLELGGKSPAIVAPGHAGARAATEIALGKLANAGQTCIAPDHALVAEADLDGFLSAYDRAVARHYPDGPAGADWTAIASDRHMARLTGLLADAVAKGARVIPVGRRPEAADAGARRMAPVVVLDTRPDMAIRQEEIFGPVLPVLTYRDLDVPIGDIAQGPRPLVIYWFGPEDAACRRMLARTLSGNVALNGTLKHFAQDDLPFGGVGASGMGACHGVEGFRRFCHARGIHAQGRPNAASLLRPLYGRLADLILSVLLR
jgi:coniferyl-aldehyde dehydrogenase